MVRKIKKIKVLVLAAVIAAVFSLGGCEPDSSTSLHEYWNAHYAEFINYDEKDENGEYLKEKGVRISGLTEEGKKQKYLTVPKKIGGRTKIRFEVPNLSIVVASDRHADLGTELEGIVFENIPEIHEKFFSAKSLRWVEIKIKVNFDLSYYDGFPKGSSLIVIYRENIIGDFNLNPSKSYISVFSDEFSEDMSPDDIINSLAEGI